MTHKHLGTQAERGDYFRRKILRRMSGRNSLNVIQGGGFDLRS
jgi:hypothetical protein